MDLLSNDMGNYKLQLINLMINYDSYYSNLGVPTTDLSESWLTMDNYSCGRAELWDVSDFTMNK